MDCTLEKNRANCPCTYDCDKKGACCQCVAYHRGKNQLPACFFPPEAEKTFDRSYEHFARLVGEGFAQKS
ncbi:DUF6485 family protein [Desulfoluna spongiiphila]|uniref:DUF6485 family protein n=1 Tax=Desulfoluna spongiiphila TaxID=419481 RepID=UPI00125B294D|nr:DUF6485 family protein [Desulfoluna spongiiphila]VVS93483.1 hypothetical protein DBB_30550 [Desulfoluna spongiiphila]